MSRDRQGNKEAKKPKAPKKVSSATPPPAPAKPTPGALAVAALRKNKKW